MVTMLTKRMVHMMWRGPHRPMTCACGAAVALSVAHQHLMECTVAADANKAAEVGPKS
jgi:hypothetical protein